MFTTLLLTLLFSAPTPADAGVCEAEWRIIDDLQAQIDEYEQTLLATDRLLLDVAGAGSGCEAPTTELQRHVCECIAEGQGNDLTRCVSIKAGA
jgi:hypothetical protein